MSTHPERPDHDVLERIRADRVIATLRAPDADLALIAVEALVEAGATSIEVTYTVPDAGRVIAEAVHRYGDRALVGAGTLTTPEQVAGARDAGAAFFVSPGFDADVVAAIRAGDGPAIIGAYTATEVQQVVANGVELVKLFPASIGGPALLRALRGPFPDVAFVPTGGIRGDAVAEWIAAGAVAVGAGSELISSEALRGGDRGALVAHARAYLAAAAAPA
ncbi:bifunctional 4-hydroxy-2-oxoglutarate aldolase/2-dehydro-3-deoxy-phosphogluconate aldolase [Pseudolysinimonas kribbensis]|uniref:2-keto-3-deoxy-phosphogluconate aldolase n=1 Tax=Pseudolysinimonas kribbensis TaxID=433641 RepID=A0ABQ6KAS6_9MICO|nr:bifunctional 4-hydroxy-2-oxoglutarate aldolase/2-dehydro-3-deoxy-phosphogluconate aldolase [Pseudolysinimonas kribbensis]GMA95995.1 2-keto-3-deoxy-phosphogluconate aldolase [Pseudolysinimonas kribbensis]